MKRILTLLALLPLAISVQAQQENNVATTNRRPGTLRASPIARSPRPAQGRALTFNGPATVQFAGRIEWLEKEINVNFKNEKPGEAVKQILKAAGRKLDAVEVDEGLPAPEISLTVKNVKVRDVLAAIGRLANATAYVSEKDEKATVHLRKRMVEFGAQVFTSTSDSFPAEAQAQINRAMKQAQEHIAVAKPFVKATGIGSWLPDKRVSLDVRNTDAREILKALLKQADVNFVLEEDVPDDKKFSFTFEDVPLRMALDTVCASMKVGWGTQKSGEDKKATVRIGKKWVTPRTGVGHFAPFAGFQTFDFTAPAEAPFSLPEIIAGPMPPASVGGTLIELQSDEEQTIL
jgi:hypothetical protein